jgi:hypothetical protein
MMVPHSLKTKWNKKIFKLGQNFYLFLKSYMTLLYLLIINVVLSKFDPLTVTGIALLVNLGPKCQNLFPLV